MKNYTSTNILPKTINPNLSIRLRSSLILLVLIVITIWPENATSQTTMAHFGLNDNLIVDNDNVNGTPTANQNGLNYGDGWPVCEGSDYLYCNGSNDYLQINLSTTGFSTISVSWQQRYSTSYGTHRGRWIIQGDSNNDGIYEFQKTDNPATTSACATVTVDLPASFDNQNAIRLRIVSIVTSGDYLILDDVTISGTKDIWAPCASTLIWSESFSYNNFSTSGSGTPTGLTSWSTDGYDWDDNGVYVYNSRLNGYHTTEPYSDRTQWYIEASDPIEIGGYSDVEIEVQLFEESDCESDDYVQVQYSLNGGSWTNFTTNGIIYNDFTNAVARQTGLSGSTLQLRIIFFNNSEDYYADDITVSGIPIVTVDDPTDLTKSGGELVSVIFTGTNATQFSWTNSNTAIGLSPSGTGNISFTAADVSTPQTSTITVTPSNGSCGGSPQTFTITVNPACTPPVISLHPSTTPQTKCLNQSFTSLTISASGTGISYQWYSNTSASTSGGTSLGSANGAQTNSYTPQSNVAGTLYYYCIVTGTCGTVTSNVSGAFVTNPATAITSESLTGQTVCINQPFSAISVTTNGVGLSYQWYSNTNASTSGGTSLGSANGAQTNTYTPQSNVAGTLYY
ncbi:MAG: hypothetical protein GXY59_03600, partial [Bacteroidales bacterium]|nr:hypothetical protein [Bacteroidales bacterium]